MERNTTKIYWFNFTWMLMICIPVIVPFFQSKGLSMEEVYWVQAVFSAVILICELPSGYLSDIIGRKKTLFISAIFHTLGFAIFPFSEGLTSLIIAEVFLGIGVSLFSGSDVAMMYDSEEALGRLEGSAKKLGHLFFIRSIGELTGSLVCILTMLSGLRATIIAQAMVTVFPIFIALTMVEPPRKKMSSESHFANTLYVAGKLFKQGRLLRLIIMTKTFFGVGTLVAIWSYQKHWEIHDIPLTWFGLLWGASNLVVGGFSKLAPKIEEVFGAVAALLLMGVGVVTGYFLFGIENTWVSLGYLIFFPLCRCINTVVVGNALNQRVGGEMRATANSVCNLGSRMSFIFMGPFFGSLVDKGTLEYAGQLYGSCYIVLIVVLLLPLIMMKKQFRIES